MLMNLMNYRVPISNRCTRKIKTAKIFAGASMIYFGKTIQILTDGTANQIKQ